MEKRHKKMLQQLRTRLANDLDLQELLQHLVADDIFTDHMLEKITSERTSYDRNDKVSIFKSHFKLYDTYSGRSTIFLFLSSGEIFSEKSFPKKGVTVGTALPLDGHSQKGMGTPFPRVPAENVPWLSLLGISVAFLVKLTTRGPKAFESFRKALIDTEQRDLAKLLELNDTISDRSYPDIENRYRYEPDSFNIVTPTKLEMRPAVQQTVPKQLYVPSPDMERLKSNSTTEKLIKKCDIAHSNNLPNSPIINRGSATTLAEQNANIVINHKIDIGNISVDKPDKPTVESLTVINSKEDFVMSNCNESYPMLGKTRGLCLIVSVENFTSSEFDDRSGGEIDRSRSELLFNQLSYEVYNLINPSAAEIQSTLHKFANWERHYEFDSCVVMLMSHGDDGKIYGKDGNFVHLEKIFHFFNNVNCPGLRNKPKIFFVQACRGGAIDGGVDVCDNPHKSVMKPMSYSKLPNCSDMLIGYATMRGYIAMRNTTNGSWFIQALVQIFAEYSHNTPISLLLTKVNERVKNRESVAPGTQYHRCKEMSTYENSLCKPLYFYPGVYRDAT